MALAHNLGFPRIGADRELKKALEAYRRFSQISNSLRVSRNHSEIIDIQNKYDQEITMREKTESCENLL